MRKNLLARLMSFVLLLLGASWVNISRAACTCAQGCPSNTSREVFDPFYFWWCSCPIAAECTPGVGCTNCGGGIMIYCQDPNYSWCDTYYQGIMVVDCGCDGIACSPAQRSTRKL